MECFYDTGYINRFIEGNYSIISGRKGSGKTAIAKYLEKNGVDYGIDLVCRVSIRDVFSLEGETGSDSILFFVITKIVQALIDKKFFARDAERYWLDFLVQNGLQNISNYETFVESRRLHKKGFSIKGILSYLGFAKAELEGATGEETSYIRAQVSNSPHSLVSPLKQSLPKNTPILFFVDDLTDYLEKQDKNSLRQEISVIRDILFHLASYNSELSEFGLNCRFVALLRDDVFEFMEGSNINKLRSDSLLVEWDEFSFACLLIKRLPFFQSNLEESLRSPIEAIRKQFPDDVFSAILGHFGTNRHKTNFYAYMVAISFNRPRDFLKFCYAMRERLSLKHSVTIENIDSAEIEYSDYLIQELRDELFIASRILNFDADYDGLNRLIEILSQRNGFNISQLRSDIGQYLDEKTSIGRKKIEYFIYELWWYGIIGFQNQQKKEELIHYRYLTNGVPLTLERIKDYFYFLHRGLWWFAQKRRR